MNKEKEYVPKIKVDSSLTNMAPSTSSEKIRRPPNAFMLFAREHRKSIAEKNPSMSNKLVSKILGNIWKETEHCVKQKYFKEAQMLDKLHKARYPGYFYSPKVARMKKEMKKMKDKKKLKGDVSAENARDHRCPEVQGQEGKNPTNEDWTPHTSHKEKPPFPEYVPNNPEYFSANGENKIVECMSQFLTPEDQGSQCESSLNSKKEVSPELHHRWNMRQENDCYGNPCRMARSRCMTPLANCDEKEIYSHFPEHHYRRHPSSAHYDSTRLSTEPTNAFYCRSPCVNSLPRYFESRFHPYWYPASKKSPYYQYKDPIYDQYIEPLRFPIPYHAYDYHAPPFRFFEKPSTRLERNTSPYCSCLDKDFDCFRKCDAEECRISHLQDQPYGDRSTKGGGIVLDSCAPTMRNEDMLLRCRKMSLDVENVEESLHYTEPDANRQELQGLGDSCFNHTNYPINAFENQFDRKNLPHSGVHPQCKVPNSDKYGFDRRNVDFGGNVDNSSEANVGKCCRGGVDIGKPCEMQPVTQPHSNCVTTSSSVPCVNALNTNQCSEDDGYVNVCDLNSRAEPEFHLMQSENSAFKCGGETRNYADYITAKEFYSRPTPSRSPLDTVETDDSIITRTNACQNMSLNQNELNNREMYVRDVMSIKHDSSVNYAQSPPRMPGENFRSSFTSDQRAAETEVMHPKATAAESQPIQLDSITKEGFHRSSPLTTMALYGNKINYVRNTDIRNYIRKPVAQSRNDSYAPYVAKRN